MFYYMGLESYPDRYTYQLQAWATKALSKARVNYTVVKGVQTNTTIKVGQVLDAHGRTGYSLTQMANLISFLEKGSSCKDVIFFEDMFTPGIESLPYIFDQLPPSKRPKVFVRCLAQTIDPDDFVYVTGMDKWMSVYEKMLNKFVTGILCSNEEMVAHAKIAGWDAPLYNISGLTFDTEEVRSRVRGKITPFGNREYDVAFTSRWDAEKQPNFYLDVIDTVNRKDKTVRFSLLQGSNLRSNDPSLVTSAREAQSAGVLTIFENLSKNGYYEILKNTKIVFNCALQDWVSNTASEGDALGCNLVFPAYRSFPETFNNDVQRLYTPWSVGHAAQKILENLDAPQLGQGKLAKHTSGTMKRIIEICQGKGERFNRSGNNYRSKINGRKT